MKKIILIVKGILLFSALISPVYAKHMPTTYAQLADAVDHGDNVFAIIYFDKCTLNAASNKNLKSNESATSRVNFNFFSHYPVKIGDEIKNTVATSNTILTEHSVLGAVYAYGRLRVFEDNSAEFHVSLYDPKTYEKKSVSNYICRINGNGNNANSIAIYDADV